MPHWFFKFVIRSKIHSFSNVGLGECSAWLVIIFFMHLSNHPNDHHSSTLYYTFPSINQKPPMLRKHTSTRDNSSVFLNGSLLLFPGNLVATADVMLCLLNCYPHIPWFNLRCVNKASMMQIKLPDDLSYNAGQHE